MKRVVLTVGLVVIGTMAWSNPVSHASSAAPDDPVKGMKVYADQKCSTCHAINGAGGKLAPDLGAIGAKRDAAWLAAYLANPTTLDPKKPPKIKMKPTTAKGADLDDLVAYLLSLKGKK
ncbi:MAG TPA: cytochrome c [Vicinamibacterales bacterium]|nr:cytochrome c [Vicinamibacterales bacterium]